MGDKRTDGRTGPHCGYLLQGVMSGGTTSEKIKVILQIPLIGGSREKIL